MSQSTNPVEEAEVLATPPIAPTVEPASTALTDKAERKKRKRLAKLEAQLIAEATAVSDAGSSTNERKMVKRRRVDN